MATHTLLDFCHNYQLINHEMLKTMNKFEKNRTKPRNPYYLVQFENRTKLGTVLSETVLSGDPLYLIFERKAIPLNM